MLWVRVFGGHPRAPGHLVHYPVLTTPLFCLILVRLYQITAVNGSSRSSAQRADGWCEPAGILGACPKDRTRPGAAPTNAFPASSEGRLTSLAVMQEEDGKSVFNKGGTAEQRLRPCQGEGVLFSQEMETVQE